MHSRTDAMQSIRRVDSILVIWLLPAVTFPDVKYSPYWRRIAIASCMNVVSHPHPIHNKIFVFKTSLICMAWGSFAIVVVSVRCTLVCHTPSTVVSMSHVAFIDKKQKQVNSWPICRTIRFNCIDKKSPNKMASLFDTQIITYRSINFWRDWFDCALSKLMWVKH